MTFHAAPGSLSADALRLLAAWSAPSEEAGVRESAAGRPTG
ncbi:hypothetical protein [Streptomyces sp. 3211]|nr:hypothetical protein [Streptomyces sp. 3211]